MYAFAALEERSALQVAEPPGTAEEVEELGEPERARTDGRAPLPSIPLLRSLSARVLFLVALLVLGSSASAWSLLIKQRRLLADLRLLTETYLPFEQTLARAREAETQLRRYRLQVLENDEIQRQPGADLVLRAAMEHRGGLVRKLAAPLQEMLPSPPGWAEQSRAPLQEILGELELLEKLVEEDELSAELESSVVSSNAAVSRINRIDRLFRDLDNRANVVRKIHDDAVAQAGLRAERYTWLVSLASLALGVITALAALWTLRPLRRLTERVRRLGAGDWSSSFPPSSPASRDNEVSRLAREFERMAVALRDREQRLIQSEKMAAIGQMAAQITHEIRNPLSSVALNVELLGDELEEVGAGPDTQELLSRVNAEVDRLAEITESYLSFARRRPPEMEELDLAELMAQLLDFLTPEHQRAEIQLERELPEEGGAWVRGDPRQLRQALLNLLRNAQEAILEGEGSPQGCAPRRIAVRVFRSKSAPGRVRVQIEDSGPGIAGSPEDWGRIFEPFVSHKAQGTGLGLPMVQQIVQAHAGEVAVLRTGPEGTQFELSFPACQGR